MPWYEPIGYVCDATIFCPVCAPDTESPIFEGSEADCFSHCDKCEDLIPESLTQDGIEYTLEALDDARNGRGGRVEILDEWAAQLRDYSLDRGPAARLSRYLSWRRRTAR